MKFRIVFLMLICGNFFQINGMESGEDEQIAEINFNAYADEVILYFIPYAVKSKDLSQTLKRLATLRLVNKKFARVGLDNSLIKTLVILHVNDNDYQDILTRILFKTTWSCVIDVLAAVPESSGLKENENGHVISNGTLIELLGNEIVDDNQLVSFLDTSINKVDAYGYTPLMCATERGNIEVAKKLLSFKAVVVIQNKDDDTALTIAVRKGCKEIVEELLEASDVKEFINIKGFGKETAFIAAAQQVLYASDKSIEDNFVAIMKLLGEHDADVNATDAADLNAMDWAVRLGKVQLIGILLDLGLHFSPQNKARLKYNLPPGLQNQEREELLEKITILEENTVVISDVELQLKNEPYWLSFKIDGERYKIEVENNSVNIKFVDRISRLDDYSCVNIGNAIVEKVHNEGDKPNSLVKNSSYDSNDYRLAFILIFGEILSEPRWLAKENSNILAIKKLKEIMKPIFRAHPDKHSIIYRYGLRDYDIEL